VSTPVSIHSVTTPKRNNQMGKIIYEGLRPDTDEIYKRGWTILTGRNLNGSLMCRRTNMKSINEENKEQLLKLIQHKKPELEQ
jgi:hypothetical protein